MIQTRRGFALIIAIVLTAVVLTLGEALLDVAYKQVLLASAAKNSQYAFYNADSGLECALYWDQSVNAFSFSTPLASGSVICGTAPVTWGGSTLLTDGITRKTIFTIPCPAGGTSASIEVYKQIGGATDIYSNGYSSCTPNNTLIERGLKVHY